MNKKISIEETIFFYTKNDFLIINNLLIGNTKKLWEVVEIANNDYKSVLLEYKNGQREMNKTDIHFRKRRVYHELNETIKKTIIETANKDVLNLLNNMQPLQKDMLLFRNIRVSDALQQYDIGDILEIKIFSSTSIAPCNSSYSGREKHFIRYIISAPKGTPALELDRYDQKNEEGEILLPPMKCVVKNIRLSTDENCLKIIELTYIEKC